MSWWKTAKPGDKVVCVNGSVVDFIPPGHLNLDLNGLSAGVVYTVRSVQVCPAWRAITVRLVEIQRPLWGGIEIGYAVERFRPVQTKSTETGMKMLRKLLSNKKAGVCA